MPVALGLIAGIGFFFMWWSCWEVPARPARQRRANPVARSLRQAGIEGVSTAAFLTICACSGGLVFLIAFVFSSSLPVACCFGLFGALFPVLVLRRRAAKRAAVFRQLWPDVVDQLRSAIRAGLALSEALSQLGERGPVELRPQFRDFAVDYRLSGHFEPALDRLKERLSDPVADRIFEALRLTREVGGSDLGRLLGTLSEFLREGARTRSELEARQSWTVNAARLAVVAPWLVLILLATQPDALSAYNSATGWVLLLVGLGVSVLCYRVMLRIGALPEEERVLR